MPEYTASGGNVSSRGSPLFLNYVGVGWSAADVIAGSKDVTIYGAVAASLNGYTSSVLQTPLFRPFTDFIQLSSYINNGNTWHIDDPAVQLSEGNVVKLIYFMTG